MPAPSGLLVVDKPAGPTSFDVVARVRRLLRAEKAGHTGTLDPLATGVLAVCLGEAVKLQQWLTDGDKGYEALVAFGAATSTEDAEGEVVARGDPAALDEGAIRAALPRFLGEIDQVPPMYSAVRVGGRRLHEAARAGEAVERAPRRVRVDAFDLLALGPVEGGLRRARLAVRCGKGTYVRTLAADLGVALGVPAHLAALRRVAAGPFTLDDAIPLAELERLHAADPAAAAARVLPLEAALRGWPTVQLSAGEARDLGHGKQLALPAAPAGLCGALTPAGALLAVCVGQGGVLRPVRVLAAIR
ncbi:tRNA pseudouridine(55) synthase TruB [Anaeromyxobacter diazotrophicus]|uniref:tRNA pseudouridine synthase B n=1 Tax=Anaeromyxobacter diazotrophicus TaxID=2590199 RepID=A0A7I9VTG7_9BACT|nr:tRNA pseudouridine(55) synthase TruB [Anaeromyxobacter diazotrophicus]GEJ59450.1 tRNA pseudouridine synthase B [Anaeromyxobacter diazotrophicus]